MPAKRCTPIVLREVPAAARKWFDSTMQGDTMTGIAKALNYRGALTPQFRDMQYKGRTQTYTLTLKMVIWLQGAGWIT